MSQAAIPPKKLRTEIWAPLIAGGLMALAGGLSLLFHQPWLFPSLGPSAFLYGEIPSHLSTRLYNTVVGHLVGMTAGFATVLVLGLGSAPGFLSDYSLPPLRVSAAVIAVTLTVLLGLLLHASHPPAAATTLLIAVGEFHFTLQDLSALIIGMLIVALTGELARYLRLGPEEWRRLNKQKSVCLT